MQATLLRKLTWKDIQEIAETLDTIDIYDNGPESKERYYSDAILILCTKYKLLPACKERYKEILPIAEKIVGFKNRRERTFDLTVLRCMVATRLHEEGYGVSDIGRTMKYDHSTVSFYLGKKKDFFALPNIFAREVRWFNQFDEALEEQNQSPSCSPHQLLPD